MSLTSLASFDAKMDANEAMYYNAHRLVDYHSRFFCALGDANIQWGRRPLIADMQEQECIDDFRMKKIDLQDFSNRLWLKIRPFLNGPKGCLLLSNRYLKT